MSKITQTQLNNAFFKAIATSYYTEIVKRTPGKGIVADGWDIDLNGNEVVINNKEFGNIILFLEDGTSPHVIKPKNKKALKWKFGGSSKIHFAKKINHPGMAARKFIYDTFADSSVERKFEAQFEKQLKKLLIKH